MKICSVTILYNPQADFFKNLESYSSKVNHVLIVDNTINVNTTQFKAKLEDKLLNISFDYFHNRYNAGLSESLNFAFSWAYRNGYTHILTMDQDSSFFSPLFFSIIKKYCNNNKIAIIAASYKGHLPFRSNYDDDFDKVLFTVTSGNVVNLSAWKQIGGFDNNLFIDEVDNDFCIKLNKEGFWVLTSKIPFLNHKLGETLSFKYPFSRKILRLGIHRPERIFFIVRNGLYVSRKYFGYNIHFSLNRIKHLGLKFLIILLFYPNKRNYLYYYFLGIKDFINKKFLNTIIK